MNSVSIRSFQRLVIAATLIALMLVTYRPMKTEAAPTSNPNKITICHRTRATTNPYRRITVSVSSIFNGSPKLTLSNRSSALNDPQANGNGHGRFQHNDWIDSEDWLAGDNSKARPVPNVYNPNTNYPSNKKRWGDIIPNLKVNGQVANRTAAPLNYVDAANDPAVDPNNNPSGDPNYVGYAIYNGIAPYAGLCTRQSAKQFCDSEIPAIKAENPSLSQAAAEKACMEELAEQDALDDAPLKQACGNDVANCSIQKLSVYGTSTGTASCSNGVATLNGSTNMSTLSGEPTFEVGTSTAFGTTLNASPTSVTGAASFTASYTIPNNNATYYFKAVVTTTDGNESVIEGGTVTLTVSGGVCSVTGAQDALPTVDPTNTTTTVPAGGFTGALRGIVWIDRNLNELKDADEPGIPFTPMVATLLSSSVGGTAGTKITFKTDGEGKYSVPKLEPGRWDVSATLITDAIAKTFDTNDGVGIQSVRSAGAYRVKAANVGSAEVIDWQAKASVPVNGIGVADFAGAGDAALKVAVEIPAECVKSTSVEINWAGYDLKLNTADDATFIVALKDKEATVKRIPYGAYSVTPICTSGVKLAAEKVVLEKKQTKGIVVKASLLPATGQSDRRPVVYFAVFMVLLGVALTTRKKVVRP